MGENKVRERNQQEEGAAILASIENQGIDTGDSVEINSGTEFHENGVFGGIDLKGIVLNGRIIPFDQAHSIRLIHKAT
ncbi:MAG TPA: hypothetical protein VI957_03235 [Candidatus Paceibacterota bacterium]